jgi:hypothetical protein
MLVFFVGIVVDVTVFAISGGVLIDGTLNGSLFGIP